MVNTLANIVLHDLINMQLSEIQKIVLFHKIIDLALYFVAIK